VSAPPKSDRNVIPRWRGYRETLLVGELEAPALRGERPWASRRGGLRARTAEWEQTPKLSFAADLVGSAVVLGASEEALEAARSLLAADLASPLLKAAARSLIEDAEGETGRGVLEPREAPLAEEIGRLRRSNRRNLRNAIRWCELSRFYTIEGQERKAERAMRVARGLAPRERYVLRSAARLEIHQGRPDRAAALLRGPAAESGDPWLLAAGLGAAAVAEERSRLVRTGRQVLTSGAYSSFDTSELASALGTIEVREGNDRGARRLFRRALEDPTDNSIAQAEWAQAHAGGIVIPEQTLAQAASWEARALRAAQEGSRREALREAWAWHYDQPFASRPAELGSYHASVEYDFESGAKIVEAALPANPREFLLLNNLAFCLASLDRPEEAARHLAAVRVSELDTENRATYLATRGLIAYRQGNPEEGHALYERSIATWRNPEARALAMIMRAREELIARTGGARSAAAEARAAGEEVASREIEAWLGQLDPVRLLLGR
jgi:Tfp pilus assembly protein PilF